MCPDICRYLFLIMISIKKRLGKVWGHMIDRCYNSTDYHYKNYGGRGIKVCEEWRASFENFYLWAINNGYNYEPLNSNYNKWQIDRIDNNGNYCPLKIVGG